MRGWKSAKSYEAQGKTYRQVDGRQLKLWTTTTRLFLPTVSIVLLILNTLLESVLTTSSRILDTLQPPVTGLDAIPAWFLRLGAPVFAAPIAQLFNQSISNAASCLVNGRQLLSLWSPKFPSQCSPVTIDQYRLPRFSHVLSKGALSEGTCIQPCNNRHLNSILKIISDFGRPAQQLLPS